MTPPLSAVRYPLSRHAVPILTITSIAAALFVPALIHHEVFTFRDHTDYFQPLRFYTAEYLRAWKLPLWNPYNASGEPWLANPQTGVFYPPTWLFLALPFAAAYMSYLLLHVALLGINAYVLFARGATRGAAAAGAVALMVCGPTVSLWDVSNNLATFAWVPLAIWCGLEHRPRLGGVVLAMAFLGGEPFFAAIAALLFVIVWVCDRRPRLSMWDRRPRLSMWDRRPRLSGQAWAPVLHAAAIAGGLSAVQLFPFLELLNASDRRAGLDREMIFKHSMPLAEWLRIGFPLHTFDFSLSQHFIPVIYVGVITVILALIALSVPRRAWPWLVLLVVSAIVAAGNHLPTGEWIARAPVTLFRYPARMVPFGALAVIALAVIGLDRIPKRRAWVDVVVVLVLLIDLVPRTFTLRVVGPLRTDRVPYPAIVGHDLKIIRLGSVPTLNRDAWMPGYLNLYTRRFDAMTPAPVESQKYLDTLTHEIVNVGIDHLDAMGVGWLITGRPVPRSRYVLVADAGNARAWRSRGAQPMARVLSYDGVRNVQSLALDASHISVRVDTPRGGRLVLTQQTAPGWRVSIDGAEANGSVYDGLFLAATVPPGKHEILWTFRPFSLMAGGVISAVTLVILAFAIALQTSSVKR